MSQISFPSFLILSSLCMSVLKKNPPPWTDLHTGIIRKIKCQVKCLPCLHISDPTAFKVVETDASDIGYGGILKQVKDGKEKIVAFTSKH